MAKKYVILACVLTAVCAGVVIYIFLPNSKKEENIVDNYTSQYGSSTIDELKLFISSSDDIKNDTYDYEHKYVVELRNVFDKLNNNTDILLNAMLDNTDINIDKLIENIKADEKQIYKILDNAYNNAKSKQYKISYTALKKYIKIQNETLYKLKEVYKKNGSLSYDTYYEMLHTTHDAMTFEETNGINFLSAVDGLIDKNK